MAQILILNLGSTSSKGAIYQDLDLIKEFTLRHSAEDLAPFKKILDQVNFRKKCVESWLITEGFNISDMDIFCLRGGLVKPIPSGIYRINETIVEEVSEEKYGAHSSNIGLVIGYLWSIEYHKEAIFLNAPVTDELSNLARFTGLKDVKRRSVFHALNQKQIALEYAKSVNKSVDELNLVVCHLGGGISVGAHSFGKIVDVNNALDGEGPFSPERSGQLSNFMVLDLVESMKDIPSIKKLLAGKSGLVSHLNTNSMIEALKMAQTDPYAREVIQAMVYQIAKQIGTMATVLKGQVDQICITGGLAYNTDFVNQIIDFVDWIAPVSVYPGEDELYALASGAVRYLTNKESLKVY
jgi:butyrate kinase